MIVIIMVFIADYNIIVIHIFLSTNSKIPIFPLSVNFSGFYSLKIVGKDGSLITSEEIIFSH
jgi:hypothetical protein